jgi:hypothetical protein
MITAIVQFQLPQSISREKAREVFSGTAPKYRESHGLVRKYYLLSEDGRTVGGVSLWESREDAERLYTAEWRNFIREKYGAEPAIVYSIGLPHWEHSNLLALLQLHWKYSS